MIEPPEESREANRRHLSKRYEERPAEMRSDEAGQDHIDQHEVSPPTQQVLSDEQTAAGCAALFGVLLLVLGLLFVIGRAIFGGEDRLPAPPADANWARTQKEARQSELVGDASNGSAASARAGSPGASFDTTRAVTLCDLNMRAQAARPGSYRSDWTWRTVERGGVVAIRRNFSAVNVMGVPIQGEYTCLVGKDTGQLVGLQFSDGGQMVTVPGRELSQR